MRESSNSSLKQQASTEVGGVFNSKEMSDHLASRVLAAQELIKKQNESPEGEPPVFVYQGEQRAWGGTRPFNPVKDDFLQLVEVAVDTYKSEKSN